MDGEQLDEAEPLGLGEALEKGRDDLVLEEFLHDLNLNN